MDGLEYTNQEIFENLKNKFLLFSEKQADWREKARKDIKFYNGDQYPDEADENHMYNGRKYVAFNRVKPYIDAVLGSEANNKQRVVFEPRKIGDSEENEILTNAGDWFREQAGADMQEGMAFRDCVICGIACVESFLKFSGDANGRPAMERISPLTMVFDADAVQDNLLDAKIAFRFYEVRERHARAIFPYYDDVGAVRWQDNWNSEKRTNMVKSDLYIGKSDHDTQDYREDKTVLIIEARWIEKERYWLGRNGSSLNNEEFFQKKVKDSEFKAIPMMRDKTYRAWLGNSGLLDEIDSPLCPDGQLGWNFITAFRDDECKEFYGLVRNAQDPQMYANKAMSQMLHIGDRLSKGGYFAEEDVFADKTRAEQDLASSDKIVELKEGTLAQGKLQPKDMPALPPSITQIYGYAVEALPDIMGISKEFLGTTDKVQANVLEKTRRQSTLNILASIFANLREYRLAQGRQMLYLLQNWVKDGTLIRVVGLDKRKYVPLDKARLKDIDFDIIIDEAPASPNQKEQTFEILQAVLPLIPQMAEAGFPRSSILTTMRHSPIPASLVNQFEDQFEKQEKEEEQEQAENPDMGTQLAQMQMQLKQMQIETQAQITQIKAQVDMTKSNAELQKAQLSANVAKIKAMAEIEKVKMKGRENG